MNIANPVTSTLAPATISQSKNIPPAIAVLGHEIASLYLNYTDMSDVMFYGDKLKIADCLEILGTHTDDLFKWLPSEVKTRQTREQYQKGGLTLTRPLVPSEYAYKQTGEGLETAIDWEAMLRDLVENLITMGTKADDADLLETLSQLANVCKQETDFEPLANIIKPMASPLQSKEWQNQIRKFERLIRNRIWDERKGLSDGDRQLSADEKYEKFIGELKVIRQESNTAKRQFMLAELAQKQGKSLSVIRSILANLDDESAAPAKQDWDWQELMGLADDAVTWLIPGFIPRGELLLLSAAPKVGKTLLASQVCLAVLTGGEVLQTKCQQGRVLYVTSDESIKSVARRLRGTGFDLLAETLRPNFRVFTDFDITNQGPLQERLNEFKPDFVVFDSLTSISRRSGLSENDAEFARPIYQLRDLLASVDAAGILIHHDNKSKEARGMEKMSGSLRIAAAAWGHWQLSRDAQEPDRRLLSITPREMEPSQHRLTINPKPQWHERGIYAYDSEVGDETGEKRSQAQQILDLLSNGDRLTVQEISAKVYCSNIYTVLNRLEGQISSDYDGSKRKVYFIPRTDNSQPDFPLPPPPLTVSPKICYSTPQTQTESEIESTNNEPNILLTTQLTTQLTTPDIQGGGGDSTDTDPEPVPPISTVETTAIENGEHFPQTTDTVIANDAPISEEDWPLAKAINDEQLRELGWDTDTARQHLANRYGVNSRRDLPQPQFWEWVNYCGELLLT